MALLRGRDRKYFNDRVKHEDFMSLEIFQKWINEKNN